MNKAIKYIALLYLATFQITYSQNKKVVGDTAYWYKENNALIKELKLKDFESSEDDFNFRFRNQGQVVELSKNKDDYSGSITNYSFYSKRQLSKSKKKDTIFQSTEISPLKAKKMYNLIQQSGILQLPSDEDIENWKRGSDGINYIIENAIPNQYNFKDYWSPSSQDSIPEAIVVSNFITALSDSLQLENSKSSFTKTLTKDGCYKNEGMFFSCINSKFYYLGYSGATKLPFGFYTAYSLAKIKNANINSSISFQYNFDNDVHHHSNLQLTHWKLFLKDSDFYDFIIYNYQNRHLNLKDENRSFENHQFEYGFRFKNGLLLAAGADKLSGEYNQWAPHLFVSKSFNKPNLATTLSTSFFEYQINYKAQLSKGFSFRGNFPIKNLTLDLVYEDFMDYRDFYFGVSTSFN